MAVNIKYGSGVFRDAEGNVVYIQGLTQNDVQTIKTTIAKVNDLEKKSANQGIIQLAYKDYYTDDTYKTEMQVGVRYRVPFNASNEFIEFDPTTRQPKTDAGPSDKTVAYEEWVMKDSTDAVLQLGRHSVYANEVHVVHDDTIENITGAYTFTQDVTMTATQDVSSLGDTKLATAKFVRDSITKNITEAGHLTGRYLATDIDEGQLVANQIVFVAAKDLLA